MRCKSYLRRRGVFIYSKKRCELDVGHIGKHTCSGSFLDPWNRFYWGLK